MAAGAKPEVGAALPGGHRVKDVRRARVRSPLRGVVLRGHAGCDAAAVTDRDAVVSRPGPDIAASVPARGRMRRLSALATPRLTGMVHVRRDLLAELGRV